MIEDLFAAMSFWQQTWFLISVGVSNIAMVARSAGILEGAKFATDSLMAGYDLALLVTSGMLIKEIREAVL